MQQTDSCIIRKLNAKDAPLAAVLEAECFSRPWSKNAFEQAFEDDNYYYLGMFDNEKMIGMAGIIVSFDTGEVTNVAVSKKYRRQGIAYKIIQELITCGKNAGVSIFTLEVREHNESAIALYEKTGFEFVGKRPGFYEMPKEDAYIYTLITD